MVLVWSLAVYLSFILCANLSTSISQSINLLQQTHRPVSVFFYNTLTSMITKSVKHLIAQVWSPPSSRRPCRPTTSCPRKKWLERRPLWRRSWRGSSRARRFPASKSTWRRSSGRRWTSGRGSRCAWDETCIRTWLARVWSGWRCSHWSGSWIKNFAIIERIFLRGIVLLKKLIIVWV